ncbi:MAG: CDP-2,3-bis-(O-geranylgeranyl)-sn-glycerol synthase [archaeon]
MILDFLIMILMYVVPLYIANSIPVVVHGRTPIDLNRKLFRKPIFGKGKTMIGALAGVTTGTLIGAIGVLVFPYSLTLIPNYIELAFYLSLGAIVGDLFKSFIKRRFGIERGEKWVIWDQLDFIIGGLIFSFIVRFPEPWIALTLFVATFFIHSGTNYLAFKFGLKKVPW